MLRKVFFLVKYWLLWTLLFEMFRVVFLLANFSEMKVAGVSNFFGSLLHGLRMDLSIAAYITLPVCLFILLSVFTTLFSKRWIYVLYSSIVLLFSLLISIADIGLFKAWGYRIDASPLRYLANPQEAWASVANQPVFLFGIFFLIAYIFLVVLFTRFVNRSLPTSNVESRITQSIIQGKILQSVPILLFTALLVIPIRGGFQLAPINQSSVYFSKNNFSNLAAVNACFSFLYSVTHHTDVKVNPYKFLPESDAENIVSNYMQSASADSSLLFRPGIKPNIIIITWESFTKKVVGLKRNGREVTPCFNRLKTEGIYFSNIYATGDRTDKGIVAVLSGYPAQATTSIVKIPSKAASLPMLPKDLNANGYRSLFFYGGEPEFANMKAYLSGGNFDEFVTVDQFDRKDRNSKWGAHDGVVMEKLLSEINKSSQPFFANWLTLSSHEPFETPVPAAIEGSDDESIFLNSLHYTDSIVNRFVEEAKKQAWWQNTIVIIVADHGHRMLSTGKKIDDFKIPLLFLGGALQNREKEITETGSQVDIAATLLAALSIDHRSYPFSKDLMNGGRKNFAYMAFNNGFGFAEDSSYFFFDNAGKNVFEQAGRPDFDAGKAWEQVSFQDYIKR